MGLATSRSSSARIGGLGGQSTASAPERQTRAALLGGDLGRETLQGSDAHFSFFPDDVPEADVAEEVSAGDACAVVGQGNRRREIFELADLSSS